MTTSTAATVASSTTSTTRRRKARQRHGATAAVAITDKENVTHTRAPPRAREPATPRSPLTPLSLSPPAQSTQSHIPHFQSLLLSPLTAKHVAHRMRASKVSGVSGVSGGGDTTLRTSATTMPTTTPRKRRVPVVSFKLLNLGGHD
jgi:hypothetical protein